MLIFNNKDHYNKLMANGFEKYPNRRDLIILAKEWHFNNGVPKNEIFQKLCEFCQRWNKDFNVSKYENTLLEVISILETPNEEKVYANKITFYKNEIENILSIVGENEKRVLFILMCVCKMRGGNFLYLNSGTPLKLSEICKLSNAKLSAEKQDYLLGSLYRQKAINISIKPLLKCEVNNIQNNGEVAFEFMPNENMINEYVRYFQPKKNGRPKAKIIIE